MTRVFHTLMVLALTAIVLFLASCFRSKPKIIQVNPAFGRYVSGYTSGMISRKQNIRIELATPYGQKAPVQQFDAMAPASADTAMVFAAQEIKLPDSAVLKRIFSFDPPLEGRAVWVSDRVIEFVPAKPLPVNQLYTVSFDLDKVARVDKDFEEFVFQFASYKQVMSVEVDGLRNYDDYHIEWQKLTGRVTTSDYAEPEQVKGTLEALVNNSSAKIKWLSSVAGNEFYFYIDSIKRTDRPGRVLLQWDGAAINSESKGKYEASVSALGDFSVTDIRVMDEDDQYLELSFSEPIMPNQNLKGLITVSDAENLTYVVEGNTVKVYADTRLSGEKAVSARTGIKNFRGFAMNMPFETAVNYEEPKPRVRIKGNGCILPNSKGLIFPFEAISLKAVDVRVVKIYQSNVHQFLQVNSLNGSDGLTRVGKVIAKTTVALDYDKSKNLKQWNAHVIDLSKLIAPEPGAIYRVSIKFNKTQALCNCEDENEDDNNNDSGDQEEENERTPMPSYTVLEDDWTENDWGGYGFDDGFDSWYYYYYDEDASPCNDYYYRGRAVSRNIIGSDLGMIYKLDDDRLSHAYISNMITAAPLGGCTVEYFDYAKQLIAQGVTDNNGMLNVRLNRKPFLMVASYGKQKGYLKLLDGESNSLSRFDVEGEPVQKGVKGFIYGERGVWRPGDSLYLNFILEDREHRLPPNYPVKFELQSPSGTIIAQQTKTQNTNNLYDFRMATSEDAETGNYFAVARVGNRMFTQNIKIETVKPNRLKIYFDVDKDRLGNNSRDTIGRLRVRWLHGAIAKNLHTVVNVSLNQTETSFPKYRDYIFDSPVKHYYSEATTIFDGNLDEKGETAIRASFPNGNTAPGMLRASFVSRVFEEGGDFSVDRYSMSYSPYKHYVGLKVPETDNYDNTLETGNTYTFNIASVDAEGKQINLNKVQMKIYKIQWRFWYERGEEDLADYIARPSTIVISDTMLKTVNGHGSYKFRINYPEYGRYLVTLTDLEGGHQTGTTVFVDWPYWSRGNRTGNEHANMLQFSTDKTNYTKGETVKLSFPSPADGRALVSIESGTRVLKSFWINTEKGETKYEFETTAEMSPSAYVHVTLLQPHASTVNDLPIRMYGVVPIRVDDPSTHLHPLLACADAWKPESNATIQIKEQDGKPMTYTLAVVDEGLLDLTRFKTPDPWNTFYAREALGVKTWDMYDAVIGAYAGKLDRLISIGGDGEGTGGKGVKANRFKPMVRYIGPFTLGAKQQRTHTIDIPNYVGSVRVMVVAEQNGAYGCVEKAVAVKKPLMVLATLPRVLGPAESVFLPVDVFAMEDHVKDVKVTVEVNELLSVEGSKQQTIRFNSTGDEVLNFRLNVSNRIGIARVKVTATSGKETATQEIELDVRTANPKVVDASEFVLEPGKSMNGKVAFSGLTGTNRMIIEVSNIPALGLERHLSYLIQYPHGCIEQTTSSVFPQLYVENLINLNTSQKSRIAQNIKAGLRRLQLFQTANGGFAYWPGEGYDSEWGSNYAGHFMLEAEKQGYTLQAAMKARWVKYQQMAARNWSNSNSPYNHPHGSETNEHIQAYRLFVLALSNNAELSAMNRMREQKTLSVAAKWRLAAAYKLIGQPEVATQLIAGLPTRVGPYRELSYSYGSDTRDEAMILETLCLMNDKTKAAPVAKSVSQKLSTAGWLSTQEASYGLMALCEYNGTRNSKEGISFTCAISQKEATKEHTEKSMYQIVYTDKDVANGNMMKLQNTGNNTLYIKVMTEGIPLIGDQSASAKDLKMKVRYLSMKGVEIQPDKIIQGTDFVAEVTITNPSNKGYLKEMTLNQIFPSGWEIHNSRMGDLAAEDDARYKDIRDDRVYSYYDLGAGSSKTFTVKLNATYLGRFYLPTVYSEAMYDNAINARIPGRWVEVVRESPVAAR